MVGADSDLNEVEGVLRHVCEACDTATLLSDQGEVMDSGMVRTYAAQIKERALHGLAHLDAARNHAATGARYE
jgi:hypothetical protein